MPKISSLAFAALLLPLLPRTALADWVTQEDEERERKEKLEEDEKDEKDEGPTAQELKTREEGKSASRAGVGLMVGTMILDPKKSDGFGGLIALNKPLWFGERHTGFQWMLNAEATLGLISEGATYTGSVGLDYGFNIYMGRRFGLEARGGGALLGAVGGVSTGAALLRGSGALVFRIGDDDRQRLKAQTLILVGPTFEGHNSHGAPSAYGAALLGLTYETPY